MSQYSTISNQSVYDVAIKTVGDFSTLFDVISQFRGINNFVPIGEAVEYTPNKAVRQFQIKIPISNDQQTTYSAIDYQSVFDVAVQLYGDISRIDEILPIIRNLGTKIDVGTPIVYTPNFDPVSLFFSKRKISTSYYFVAPSAGNRRLLEDGSYRLLETSDYRLLE